MLLGNCHEPRTAEQIIQMKKSEAHRKALAEAAKAPVEPIAITRIKDMLAHPKPRAMPAPVNPDDALSRINRLLASAKKMNRV